MPEDPVVAEIRWLLHEHLRRLAEEQAAREKHEEEKKKWAALTIPCAKSSIA